WCGAAPGRDHVLNHLDQLIIRPAFWHGGESSDGRASTVFGGDLDPAARDALAAQVRADPRRYVGQARVGRSTCPAWRGGAFRPEPFVLRVFAVATEGDYVVAPTALALLGAASDPLSLSTRAAVGSKDVWILSDQPEPPAPLLAHPGQALTIRRGGVELTSRVADNLYWLGRLAERCEDAARVFRTAFARVADAWVAGEPIEIDALMGTLDAAWRGPIVNNAPSLEEAVLRFMLEDRGPSSFVATSAGLRDLAWLVRDRLSADAWRVLDDLDRLLRRGTEPLARSVAEGIELAEGIILRLAGLAGLATENMTRGPAWRFFDLGRRIERAVHTTQLVRSTLVDVAEEETAVLRAVLEVADSAMTFRSRYRTRLATAPVIDLLVLDESNPRSIAFQLARVDEHVRELGQWREGAPLGAEERMVLGALTRIRTADVDRLCRDDGKGRRKLLDRLLDHLGGDLPALSDAITQNYFTHVRERPRMPDQLPDAPS
ncbi:MAG: circularly permuted type 2 ATP-grasp protein, partial [Myxococcales bacterium]|nr:circularly permuted type 2 ATP-grasp protein [Myxococcales bacterium]